MVLWLRFITASDLAPSAIVVNFEEQAPSVRTCSNILNLSASYSCYNELDEEFTNAGRNKESFTYLSFCMKPITFNLTYLVDICKSFFVLCFGL